MSETLLEAEHNWHVEEEIRIISALDVIDRALGTMASRKLVSTDEASDALLDVRNALVRGEITVSVSD